jgi:ribosomal-protein-alanine N-acetyltransferase
MNIRRANSGIRMASHRLVLREFVVTDEDAVHAFAADPLVTRFTDWDPTASKTPEHSLAEATAWATNPPRAEFRQYLLGANRPRTGYP